LPYDGINNDDDSLWETGHNTYEVAEEEEETTDETTTDDTTDDTTDTTEVVDILQEFHWIVNGRNMDEKSYITMAGWRCEGNVCPNEYGLKECEADTRLWSDPASWSSGVVPVEGDFVDVETGWNMIYDLEGDLPLFEMITLSGCLTFY
jgi:hypothetical protein